MNKENEKAVFVIANYRFPDANQFSFELEHSESFKPILPELKKALIKTNFPLPEGFPIPIAAYRKNNTEILYSAGDSRLNISSDDYNQEKESLKTLLSALAQFKLQEISAIGINFSADCCTGGKRLSVFSSKINNDTITNWSKNTGFTITLPLDLNDIYNCSASYFVSKVKGGIDNKTNEKVPYIYNISVNYNFAVNEDKADVRKRLDKLESVIKLTDDLYNDFNTKCIEITNL